jgi:uncharacterized protein YjbI with pentapeptide repeats
VSLLQSKPVDALAAEVLAVKTVIGQVLGRVHQLDPVLAEAIEGGIEDAQEVIRATVNYRASLFQRDVIFSQSMFNHVVSFDQVSFQSNVYFRDSLFRGKTSFSGSIFEQPPTFDSVKMPGANFNGADLRGADLSNIIFDKSTKFPK